MKKPPEIRAASLLFPAAPPNAVAPGHGPSVAGAKVHAEDFVPVNGLRVEVDKWGNAVIEIRIGLQDTKDGLHLQRVFTLRERGLSDQGL